MSQQGPGGFGGPPPGGYGGPPPGGYGGPPPGGHGGAPPGGHGGWGPPGPGGPPGGPPPPGWGQPPPGAPQQPPAGGPPKPAKKGNVGLLLGLGCAGLLVLGAAGAAGVYFYVIKPAQDVKAAVEAAGQLGGATVSLSDGGIVVEAPNGVTANVTDAGVVVKTPSGATVPLDSLGFKAGGPICEQAASCCKTMATKTGNDPSALAVCNSFQSMPAIGCQKALEAYRQSAAALGAACP